MQGVTQPVAEAGSDVEQVAQQGRSGGFFPMIAGKHPWVLSQRAVQCHAAGQPMVCITTTVMAGVVQHTCVRTHTWYHHESLTA